MPHSEAIFAMTTRVKNYFIKERTSLAYTFCFPIPDQVMLL